MDFSCVASAILFWISNILNIVLISKYHARRGELTYDTFIQLDPSLIQDQFAWRIDNQALQAAGAIMNAIAWFSLMIPIFQVTWVQQHASSGKGSTRHLSLHMTVAALAVGGSLSEFLATLMLLGFTNTSEWLAKDFNLDNWLGQNSNDQIGWRALEVTFLVVEGVLLWIDSLEWLALFGITTLLFCSVHRGGSTGDRLLSTRWAYFGLLLGTLSLVDFAASVLRFQSWRTFSVVAMAVSAVNRLLILPIWLLWLGRLLPGAKSALETRGGSTNDTDATEASFSSNDLDPGSSLS